MQLNHYFLNYLNLNNSDSNCRLWYKYLKTLGVYNTYENKNMTLYNSFKEVAKKYPDDVMFLFGDNKWTYKEVDILF